MKVQYFQNQNYSKKQTCPKNEPNILCLHTDGWDDHGIKTTLHAFLFFNSELFLEFELKILIEGEKRTSPILNELVKNGWDGIFPLPETNYVSVPGNFDFYNSLISHISEQEALKVINNLRDAGYFVNILKDSLAVSLCDTEDFSTSLLRETDANKAYIDGWKIFDENQITEMFDFSTNIMTRECTLQTINYKFNSQILPYDINVLIGPNGVGKSHCLKLLVDNILGIADVADAINGNTPKKFFDKRPNARRLALVSYSPFDEFSLDLKKEELKDKKVYEYFGFRYKDDSGIHIDRDLPSKDAKNSIRSIIFEDNKFKVLKNWIGKLDTVYEVLSRAFEFDHIAIDVTTKSSKVLEYFDDNITELDNKNYFIFDNDVCELALVKPKLFMELISKVNQLVFIDDNGEVLLSSGQKIFSYIVINIIGSIKNNSLIVIDEPELFLHPSLEIEFIKLLKNILKAFGSKAILATHSAGIVREIPSPCVHVMRNTPTGIKISTPPFQTFGGDMQRISSYVFEDDKVSKPYEIWIQEKLNHYGSSEKLIKALGKDVNEEMLIAIMNSEVDDGC